MKIFLKTGCIVFTCFLIAALFYEWIRPEIAVTAAPHNLEIPICSVETDQPEISLTFDISGGNEDIGQILDILSKHQIHASFFVTGEWVDSYPEDVKKIANAGHDLGNHGDSHKTMSLLSGKECQQELMSLHNKVKKLTGTDMKFFRPPYGNYSSQMIASARKCGYETVLWNCDSMDWKNYGADAILKTLCTHPHLGNGSILLMHNDTRYTAGILDKLLTALQSKGYEIVPLSQLILKDNFHLDADGRQFPNT